MSDEFTAARRGAAILRRYSHPDDWVCGVDFSDELAGLYMLYVDELQRGADASISSLESDANTFAVRAWAQYVSLLPPDTAVAIIATNQGIYLGVPVQYWDAVLPELQQLYSNQ